MLKITDLVKRFDRGNPVLEILDLTIEGESVVSIIGSSGAGKSTLLRCINRLARSQDLRTDHGPAA
ncbi:ABC transporter ATP-binding protein-aspartateglutamate transport [Profundibacterium mesophilum KAUST100406-0324]|uniref:ABC transporter ATP-binding protein-aspartateglutamate transport n=1 Tax=Profundibacterium mesophilum KAUST100406-0324 TaxID=1037889 RepID=A0A921TGH8_9RHOB|nr:ABC transporter ATP-binding protein-aspartateglutamate transport [Profundibacterium mesophilum KAUST100406-0324]